MAFSPSQQLLIEKTIIVVSSISIALSLCVLITYLLFKRKFPSSMVIYFTFSILCLPSSLLIGPIIGWENLGKSTAICYTQAFGIQFFGAAIVWWFFSIAFDL
jgi:hypothetical protein